MAFFASTAKKITGGLFGQQTNHPVNPVAPIAHPIYGGVQTIFHHGTQKKYIVTPSMVRPVTR